MTAYFDSAADRLRELAQASGLQHHDLLHELERSVVEECAVCLELLRLMHPEQAEALLPFIHRFDLLVVDGSLFTRPSLAPRLPALDEAQQRSRVRDLFSELHTLWHDLKHACLAADDPRVPRGTLSAWSEDRQERLVGARFGDPDLQQAIKAIERGERPYADTEPS